MLPGSADDPPQVCGVRKSRSSPRYAIVILQHTCSRCLAVPGLADRDLEATTLPVASVTIQPIAGTSLSLFFADRECVAWAITKIGQRHEETLPPIVIRSQMMPPPRCPARLELHSRIIGLRNASTKWGSSHGTDGSMDFSQFLVKIVRRQPCVNELLQLSKT